MILHPVVDRFGHSVLRLLDPLGPRKRRFYLSETLILINRPFVPRPLPRIKLAPVLLQSGSQNLSKSTPEIDQTKKLCLRPAKKHQSCDQLCARMARRATQEVDQWRY